MEDLKIKHLFIVEMKDLECLTFYCRFFRFFLDPSILQFRLPQKTHWVHLPVGISFFVHWKNGTKLVRKLRQSFLYKTQHFYVLSRNLNLCSVVEIIIASQRWVNPHLECLLILHDSQKSPRFGIFPHFLSCYW